MAKGKKSNNPMLKVIDDGLTGIHESSCALARIWRILLWQTNIDGATWHTLLNKWQARALQNTTEKEAASLKGNISRGLSKTKISWSGLLKGLTILQYEKMEIKLILWKHNKPHELTIKIDDIYKESSISEIEEEV